MRVFKSGAIRDNDKMKLDFDGAISPIVLERFVQYMNDHANTAKGFRPCDDWQKGVPMSVYRKSFLRHSMEAWKLGRAGAMIGDAIENLLCAVLFNVQGWLHEAIKARLALAAVDATAAARAAHARPARKRKAARRRR